MNKNILCSGFLLFFCNFLFAQSVAVSSNTGSLYDGVDHVRQGHKVSGKKKGFILAVAPGYVSKGETYENILKKGGGQFNFKLEKETKPKLVKNSKKIKFVQFYSNTVGYTTVNGYMYGGINLKDNEFALNMNQFMKDWGFTTVMEGDDPFKSKSNVPSYAIAGNIINYEKTTRGTSSFEMGMLVKWTVFDVYNEENALELVTAGYSDSRSKNSEKQDAILAMKDAMKGLMVNEEFLKLINNESKTDDTKSFQSLRIVNTGLAQYAEYGKMVTSSIKSCVTIKTLSGHGSGFIISEDGYILTNAHVINDSAKIEAIFDNGFKFAAKIIRSNTKYDVALLKIEGNGFTPLPLDTTESQIIGSEVITIGTPEDLRLGQTVTKGIVSSVREIEDRKLIQTDVSINPGNSGGPLILKSGNVVGIISSKISGEKIQGLGFAIPINFALEKINVSIKK